MPRLEILNMFPYFQYGPQISDETFALMLYKSSLTKSVTIVMGLAANNSPIHLSTIGITSFTNSPHNQRTLPKLVNYITALSFKHLKCNSHKEIYLDAAQARGQTFMNSHRTPFNKLACNQFTRRLVISL